MGRFWMDDDFIRIKAKQLSPKAICVYVALSSYSNGKGETWVGYRTLASILNMSKTTITAAIKELSVYQYLVHLPHGSKGVSHFKLQSVPIYEKSVPPAGTKGSILRNNIKELTFKSTKGEFSPIKEQLRKRWGKH